MFEPLSGDSGAGGKQEMLGMQYANYETPTVTIGGEEYKVELVYADNGSSTDKAPTAAQTAVSQGVSVVLGSYGSGVSIAAGPTFAAARAARHRRDLHQPPGDRRQRLLLPHLLPGSLPGHRPGQLRQGEVRSAKTAYCLGEQGNEYDQGLINYFSKAFRPRRHRDHDAFPTNNSDFTTYLTKAKPQGAT